MTGPALRPAGQRLLTAGLVFMVTAIAFEGLAVTTVLPATLEDLGGLELYGWAFSGFFLTSLVAIGLAARDADRHGVFRSFAIGTALFSIGLAIAGLAPSMEVVVGGRALQGLGAGAISAVLYVAIARGYAPERQPRMIAIVSSAWVLPGIVGPALAGYVAEAASWRLVFLALVPLVPLTAVAVSGPMRRLRAGDGAAGATTRVRDALLLTLGAALVLAGLSARVPWLAALLAIPGLGLAGAAVARLLPAGTLRLRPGRGAAVGGLALISLAFFGAEAFIPLAVATVRGAGTLVGGLSLTTAAVTWAAGSWVQARLAHRGTRRPLIAAGFGLVLVGIGVVSLVLLPQAPILLAALGWAIAGLGMGLAYSTITLVLLETTPRGAEGANSASIQLSNVLGIALGTGAAGAIVAGAAGLGVSIGAGIVAVNVMMGAVAVVGLVAARRIPEPAVAPRPGQDFRPADASAAEPQNRGS